MRPVTRACLLSAIIASGVGCRDSKRTAPAAASPSSSATPSSRGVEGEVSVDAPAKGRLVVGWLTADEQREEGAASPSLKTIRKMIDRWKVGDVVDFGKTPRVRYRIEGAPADATAVVILDTAHDFWLTWSGAGGGKMGSSKPGGGDVKLTAPTHRSEASEPCAGPRYKLIEVASQGLPASKPPTADAGARESTRRFCAWLPPSWASKPERRYPVIYLLPGLFSTETGYLRGEKSAAVRVDAITAELGREVILVGVDTSSPLGSTYLEDSPVTGAWDTFFARRALPEIERALPVIRKRTARALIGQSTGGLNALSYGLRHSELFSVIGSSSPDAPDMEAWMIEPGSATSTSSGRAREWIRHWAELEAVLGGPGQMTSYAADWAEAKRPVAPDRVGDDGRSFVPSWPFDLASGVIDKTVLDRWIAHTPHGFLRDPRKVAELKKDLSGRVFISVGRNDEFGLFTPAERFAKELDDAGVKTTFVPTNDGHGNSLGRIEAAMRFALDRLDEGH